MKEKYKYLGTNTIIFAISSFGTKFLSFFLVPLYTNVLTTEEYGVADIITTTATLIGYVFTLNIAEAVLRFALEKKEQQDDILAFGTKIILGGSLIVILLMLALSKSGILAINSEYYFFVFLHFYVTVLYQLITNYLRAVDKVKCVAVAGILSSAVLIVCNIVFLLVIKIGLVGYMISLCMGPFVGSIYGIIKAEVPLSVYFQKGHDKVIQKAMILYSVPLIFNSLALWINAFLDKYFVTALCGVEQNGIYAVSYKIPTILSTCYMVFSQAWNLSAVKEFDSEDKDGFFSDTYSIYNCLIVCVCSVLIMFNIPIAKILYAKAFFEAWKYSSVLLIAIMFNAMTSFLGSVFVAVKDSKAIAYTTLFSAVVNIVLNILLIPYIGVLGAAIATAITYASLWFIRLVMAKKYIKLRVNLVKDVVAYLLLVGQVVIEHLGNVGVVGQIIVFILILFLYRKNILKIVQQIILKLKNKVNYGKN